MSLVPPRPDVPEVAGIYDLNVRRDLKAARDKIEDLEQRLAAGIGITPADTRKVTCRWCGIELDAVIVLLEMAKKERRRAPRCAILTGACLSTRPSRQSTRCTRSAVVPTPSSTSSAPLGPS